MTEKKTSQIELDGEAQVIDNALDDFLYGPGKIEPTLLSSAGLLELTRKKRSVPSKNLMQHVNKQEKKK